MTNDLRKALSYFQEILRVHADDTVRPKAFYIASKACEELDAALAAAPVQVPAAQPVATVLKRVKRGFGEEVEASFKIEPHAGFDLEKNVGVQLYATPTQPSNAEPASVRPVKCDGKGFNLYCCNRTCECPAPVAQAADSGEAGRG